MHQNTDLVATHTQCTHVPQVVTKSYFVFWSSHDSSLDGMDAAKACNMPALYVSSMHDALIRVSLESTKNYLANSSVDGVCYVYKVRVDGARLVLRRAFVVDESYHLHVRCNVPTGGRGLHLWGKPEDKYVGVYTGKTVGHPAYPKSIQKIPDIDSDSLYTLAYGYVIDGKLPPNYEDAVGVPTSMYSVQDGYSWPGMHAQMLNSVYGTREKISAYVCSDGTVAMAPRCNLELYVVGGTMESNKKSEILIDYGKPFFKD